MKQLFRYDFLTIEEAMANPLKTSILHDCLGMYDMSMSAKSSLNRAVSVCVWLTVVGDVQKYSIRQYENIKFL